LQRAGAKPDQDFFGQPLADVVMAPTRLYVKPVLAVIKQFGAKVKGLAHITGGGLLDNVPRILQSGLQAKLHRDAWQMPKLFTWLQQQGGVADTEMHRVFNCGIGMVVVVSAADATAITQALVAQGETVYTLGVIQGCQTTDPQTVVV
jgi:phosphoribosylformylglycinamidine cyclo-ligase